jgi:hypothetical protein
MRNSYTNESRKYKILHHTKWSKGNDIEVPTRLIVIQFTPMRDHGDYALRWQNKDGATYGGGAFETETGATARFMRSVEVHNAIYRVGNPSHLPGVVK